jgi:hypothetical protein
LESFLVPLTPTVTLEERALKVAVFPCPGTMHQRKRVALRRALLVNLQCEGYFGANGAWDAGKR